MRMLAKAYLLRYYSVPRGVWKLAYAIHRRAEKAGSAKTPVRVHANLTSSATQELLRLLMLSASAPELMAPDQIEVADRVIEPRSWYTRSMGFPKNPVSQQILQHIIS